MIRLLLVLLLTILAASCGLFSAVEELIVGSQEAVDATRKTAEQAESTLATLEQVLMLGGAYLMGELRRPVWNKVRNRGRKKDK